MQTKLADARAKQQGAEEVLKLRQERVERFKKFGPSEAVSQKELDEALVQLSDARTQLAAARAAAELLETALQAIEQRGNGKTSAWSEALKSPDDGEIAELAGRPGAAVEAGSLVARVVDFRRPLARLDVPPELLATGPPPKLQLSANPTNPAALRGAANQPASNGVAEQVEAALVGPAPRVNVASLFVSYWYEVSLPASGAAKNARAQPDGQNPRQAMWRPGLQVKADIQVPSAKPQAAVSVPQTAVLYHLGRALVYVRVGEGEFHRREVRILGRDHGHWIIAPRQGSARVGVAPGELLVYRQAQLLLSEEFRTDAGDEDDKKNEKKKDDDD